MFATFSQKVFHSTILRSGEQEVPSVGVVKVLFCLSLNIVLKGGSFPVSRELGVSSVEILKERIGIVLEMEVFPVFAPRVQEARLSSSCCCIDRVSPSAQDW